MMKASCAPHLRPCLGTGTGTAPLHLPPPLLLMLMLMPQGPLPPQGQPLPLQGLPPPLPQSLPPPRSLVMPRGGGPVRQMMSPSSCRPCAERAQVQRPCPLPLGVPGARCAPCCRAAVRSRAGKGSQLQAGLSAVVPRRLRAVLRRRLTVVVKVSAVRRPGHVETTLGRIRRFDFFSPSCSALPHGSGGSGRGSSSGRRCGITDTLLLGGWLIHIHGVINLKQPWCCCCCCWRGDAHCWSRVRLGSPQETSCVLSDSM